MDLSRLKPLVYGQLAGTFIVNIILFIHRLMTIGFYEAVGRTVVGMVLSVALIAVAAFVGIGFIVFLDYRKAKKSRARIS